MDEELKETTVEINCQPNMNEELKELEWKIELAKRDIINLRTCLATRIMQLQERDAITTWKKMFTVNPPRRNTNLVKEYEKNKEEDGWCWYSKIAKNKYGTGDGMIYGPRLARLVYGGYALVRLKKDEKRNILKRQFKILKTI